MHSATCRSTAMRWGWTCRTSPAPSWPQRSCARCEQNGRAFLRNVRHGLYLLPFSVRANIGIGCPIDPAFALGGLRAKNPYGEKLEAAARNGLAVDDGLWQRFT